MAFPTTVDTIVDAPPFGPNTLGHASQVLGPQRITVGPIWLNVLSDDLGGPADPTGVADSTTAIQARITAAGNAGGGIVFVPPGTYKITAALLPAKSNIEIRGTGANSILSFQPTAPFVAGVNDRPLYINGGITSFRQMAAGAIAVGATSFTAQNSSDAALFSQGDWAVIAEYDSSTGEVINIDWMQVNSVAGAVVNTMHPFRTAFANVRTFSSTPPLSGLGFFRITNLIENCRIRDLFFQQPAASQSNPAISITLARRTLVENCYVNNAFGQAYYSYRSSDLTIRDCWALFSGTSASELAATVDLVVQGCTFGFVGTAGNQVQANGGALTLDFGTGHFAVVGNRITNAGNIALQLVKGVHDGVVSGNVIGWTRNAGIAGIGILGQGCQRLNVHSNVLEGGDGAGTGINFGNTTGLTVNINTNDNLIAWNAVRNFGTLYSSPTAGSSDVFIIGDSSANNAALEIFNDTTVRDSLMLRDIAGPRNIKLGPGTGGAGQFGIYDATGAVVLSQLLYATGQLKTFGGMSPGNVAGGMQTSRLFMGTGVPTGGSAGDWFLRTDGGGAGTTHLYFNNAGTWLAVA